MAGSARRAGRPTPLARRPPVPHDALARAYAEALFAAPSRDGLFNPYRDAVPGLDAAGAAATRRANLLAALAALPPGPVDVLVVAEAPGPWGTRFSGVPLASEAQLLAGDYGLRGSPTSARFEREGRPHGESSSTIYRAAMAGREGRFWTWSTVPLHPHRPGAPLTIRAPTTAEARAWHGLLTLHAEALAPRVVVAVGRHAERALAAVGVDAVYVRHPSQGGATAFRAGIAEVWAGLDS